jgi:hypothetical protein
VETQCQNLNCISVQTTGLVLFAPNFMNHLVISFKHNLHQKSHISGHLLRWTPLIYSQQGHSTVATQVTANCRVLVGLECTPAHPDRRRAYNCNKWRRLHDDNSMPSINSWHHGTLWSDSMTCYGLTAWHGMVWQHDTVWSDSMTAYRSIHEA